VVHPEGSPPLSKEKVAACDSPRAAAARIPAASTARSNSPRSLGFGRRGAGITWRLASSSRFQGASTGVVARCASAPDCGPPPFPSELSCGGGPSTMPNEARSSTPGKGISCESGALALTGGDDTNADDERLGRPAEKGGRVVRAPATGERA